MMKTTKILLGLAMSGAVLTSGSLAAFAENVSEKESKGDIGFTTPKEGALTLLNVADLTFGSHEISAKDETYTNEDDVTTAVQDIRGTNVGWTLQVAESGQFKSGATELTAAKLTFQTPIINKENSSADANVKTKISLNPDGSASTILDATTGQGNGVTVEEFDTGAVELFVPGKTVKIADNYETTLSWTLLDQPAND